MKIAIYGRVSSERQEKQETIKSQLEALREFAKAQKHTVYEEYIDEGYSGELLDRPALDRLRDDAKKKLFETVLVHSPDRLSRKFIYLGVLQEELKKSSVNLLFLNRPDSKDTPEDNLLTGVQGLIAEYEKAKILERTRRGRLHKAKRGVVQGGRAPYGYRYVNGDRTKNIDGYYVIDKEEAKIVKFIFKLFVEKGVSIRGIIRELTDKGIKPQRGRHWRTSTLHRILTNETYTGLTHYNKHMAVEVSNGGKYYRRKNNGLKLRPRDQWIPISLPKELVIIDKDIHRQAIERFVRNAKMSPRNTKHQYLLRGLVECGNCGSPYGGEPCHNVLFYRCRNRQRKFPLPTECKERSIKADKLEISVWGTLSEALSDPRLLLKYIDKLNDRKSEEVGDIEERIEELEKSISTSHKEENRLLDAYRAGVIPLEKLKEQITTITTKRTTLEQDKNKLVASSQNRPTKTYIKEKVYEYCNTIKNKLQGLDFYGKRYVLTQAVNTIIYHNRQAIIRGSIPIEDKPALANVGIESTAIGRYGCLRLQFPFPFLYGHAP